MYIMHSSRTCLAANVKRFVNDSPPSAPRPRPKSAGRAAPRGAPSRRGPRFRRAVAEDAEDGGGVSGVWMLEVTSFEKGLQLNNHPLRPW